jgi:FKBP-type peptidyl-prolyl cis-trans isomerase
MKRFFLYALGLSLLGTAASAQVTTITPKGAQYQIFTHNTGPKIKQDDIITFNVVERTDKDSVLFNSYTTGHPIQIKIQPSQNVADLMDIFPLLSAKDSAIVKVPVDSVFKGHETERPAYLSAKGYISFAIKVEKVQSLAEAIAERNAGIAKMQQNELVIADKYIADNKLAVKATPSGLKYVITQPSTGRKPVAGDTLLVNYTGRTLNGKVFDSSIKSVAQAGGLNQPGRNYEPIKVVVGQGQVIPGWDEGLLLLNQGSKATFVIPSTLAYGAQGAGEDIAPFSTLVFDVELVKVSPAPHKAPAAKPATTTKATTAKKKTTTVKKSTTAKKTN